MPKKPKLRAGDIVRAVGERGTAKIKSILPAVNGALLEKAIGDSRNWNLDDLRLVKRGTPPRSVMRPEHRDKIAAYWRKSKPK